MSPAGPMAPRLLSFPWKEAIMASHAASIPARLWKEESATDASLRWLAPVGRLLFAVIFLMSVPGHFTRHEIDMATSHGVPLASILVPLSGLLALAGGLSVALGYHARIGGLLLVAFLVPVTLMMHDFWNVTDPQERMMQSIMFMKNLSMLGAALLLTHFGSGPVSVDQRR